MSFATETISLHVNGPNELDESLETIRRHRASQALIGCLWPGSAETKLCGSLLQSQIDQSLLLACEGISSRKVLPPTQSDSRDLDALLP